MEAPLSVAAIPEGGDWQYEPKWDGFRCVAFRDGGSIHLQSKSLQPLARYFPEVAKGLAELEAKHFVLDGEIAVPEGRGFSFDALLQQIHPAASRVKRLAAETPAIYIVFDLLAVGNGMALLSMPLRERRARLERFSAQYFGKGGLIRLSRVTEAGPSERMAVSNGRYT
jgi:ATP-dependent DNA ligase